MVLSLSSQLILLFIEMQPLSLKFDCCLGIAVFHTEKKFLTPDIISGDNVTQSESPPVNSDFDFIEFI